MATAKKQTKKDLEKKIAELEGKLDKLTTQLKKSAEVKTAPKPAETKPAPKPAERPAATSKPAGTLPKGMEKPSEVKTAPKPAERPAATSKPAGTLPKGMEKPADAPKSVDKSEPPSNLQQALENAYMTAPMTDFHQYKAKVTGYTPAPNRYFVRLTAPVGTVPTRNWNDQKVKVTGYTAASNQYFATRARLAYHPADKTFGSFSGVNLSVDGIQVTVPESAKPKKGTLPKGF